MSSEGVTPIEVPALLQFGDYDLSLRCLEVVRSSLPSILPEGFQFRVEMIPLCYHHPSNCYPAFGVVETESWEQIQEAEIKINAWVAARGFDWFIAESKNVTAPSWDDLQARWSNAL